MNEIIAKVTEAREMLTGWRPPFDRAATFRQLTEGFELCRQILDHLNAASYLLKKAKRTFGIQED